MNLKEYLDEFNISMNEFSRKANVDRQVIYRAISGGMLHLDKAIAIHDATDGHVSIEDLLPEVALAPKKKPKKEKA